MNRLNPLLLAAAVLATAIPRPAAAAASPPVFPLKRILISDTEAKVLALRPPAQSGHIVLWSEPLLQSDAFNRAMSPFFGRPITPESIRQLTAALVAFVRGRGQQLVNVSVPNQSIAHGDLRLVAVIGRFNLTTLILNNDDATIGAVQAPPGSRAIVVQNVPLVETNDFAKVCAPFFDRPITDDSIQRLVTAIDGYVKSKGELLAKVYIPSQTISGGQFRMALSIGRYPLRRLIIADTDAAAAAAKVGPGAGSIVTVRSPVLATRQFRRYIAPFFREPITVDSTERMRTAIVAYLKRHDLAIVSVPPPSVDLSAGEIRLAAVIGRYGDLVFRGNRWFSDRLLERKLGIKPGEEVRLSTLQNALSWANQNPFRHVQALVNTINTAPGIADLDISVTERVPIRVALSYDDAGNDVIGNNQYSASVLFGNLWGRDNEFSYQFTTTQPGHLYRSHTFDYKAPLPWRNYVEFSAAYALVRPSFYNGIAQETNKNFIADVRYEIPFTLGKWSFTDSIGVDYKQVQTDFVFGGIPITAELVPAFSPYDVAQATEALTADASDAHGKWTFGLTADVSPGDINRRDTDQVYGGVHGGAGSRYAYGMLQLLRESDLPADFQLFSRAQAQLSTANLMPSEQLTIGGQATVRGYNERIFSGDQGWQTTEELRGPLWRTRIPFLSKKWARLFTRPLVFWDYARVYYKHPEFDDYPVGPLMSAGVGLRSNWASNFNLAVDYGWQLLQTPVVPQPNHCRGDIQLTLAY